MLIDGRPHARIRRRARDELAAGRRAPPEVGPAGVVVAFLRDHLGRAPLVHEGGGGGRPQARPPPGHLLRLQAQPLHGLLLRAQEDTVPCVEVRHVNILVPPAGVHFGEGGVGGERPHGVGVHGEGLHAALLAEIPQPQRVVGGAAQAPPPARVQHQRLHVGRMPLELKALVASARIPHAQALLRGARDHHSGRLIHRQRVHRLFVPVCAKRFEFARGSHGAVEVPNVDLAAEPSGDKLSGQRRSHDRLHVVCVLVECAQTLASVRPPCLDCGVGGA
mmetsp:Transcript_42652/g.71188  ORF Transcript_42652/g.71188 Transcript_42652/m.71188 type:complete len:277 (-) Transcript_42652:461-1291(-)